MELTNEFRVGVPPADAWALLTDVERIAPCMPGAQLQEIDGDEYKGIVKVKVGPITAQYKGVATFVEQDQAAYKAVLKAEGRETRGQGNASAIITATLAPDGEGTHVTVVTDLTVTGKVAQFGRGVMADVSAKLLSQFVTCLESKVLVQGNPATLVDTTAREHTETSDAEAEPAPTDVVAEPAPQPATATAAPATAPATAAAKPAPRKIDSPEPEPVDLVGAAGAPVVKRVAPIVALVAIAWLLRVLIRRRHR